MDGRNTVYVGGDHDASIAVDMTPQLQTPKMPPDSQKRSLPISPSTLRREVEACKNRIAADVEMVKVMENDYKAVADRSNPIFAEFAIRILDRIRFREESLEWNRNRLSVLETKLEKAEVEAELRAQGMLRFSIISTLLTSFSFPR